MRSLHDARLFLFGAQPQERNPNPSVAPKKRRKKERRRVPTRLRDGDET